MRRVTHLVLRQPFANLRNKIVKVGDDVVCCRIANDNHEVYRGVRCTAYGVGESSGLYDDRIGWLMVLATKHTHHQTG